MNEKNFILILLIINIIFVIFSIFVSNDINRRLETEKIDYEESIQRFNILTDEINYLMFNIDKRMKYIDKTISNYKLNYEIVSEYYYKMESNSEEILSEMGLFTNKLKKFIKAFDLNY